MLTHFSSNVVLSKARAMYGKRLKSKDYTELLNCRSVSEVTSFLKGKTNYNEILQGLDDNNIHRGRLENLLRQKFFYDSALLCRYELSTGHHFAEYLIESFEIKQLMHSLILLCSGSTEEYLYSMPMFFNKHTKIDLPSLPKMKNYDEFLQSISRSKYKDILEKFKPRLANEMDLPIIEHELYTDLYEKIFDIIYNYSKGSEKRELLNMMNIFIDIRNFVMILRLKKYYKSNSEYIKSNIFKFGTLKQKSIDQMINASDTNEIIKIMKLTKAGHQIEKVDLEYIDEIYNKVRFKLCRRNLRFSVNSASVMLSYIFLLETEISNIIKIIEGVRYKVASEEINKMIVYRKE